MIKFQNIHKKWGDKVVLSNLSMEIPKGSRFCLVGMSGSGKSVCSKLMLGLEEPDSGEVWIDGENTKDFSEKEWQKIAQKFGVVFQNAALFSSLNILENVGIRLWEERKLPTNVIIDKVVESLENVGLSSHILQQFPDELSGGMRKRVGIARAIIHQPEYLIYDEPTTGLDPINANLIDDLIVLLAAEKNRTSIVITHDFHTLKKLNGTVAMLHHNHIYFEGTCAAFFESNDDEIQNFLSRK